MKVVDWIAYPRADGLPEAPIGGLGGWFGHNPSGKSREELWGARHGWADYLARWDRAVHAHAEALRDAIVAARIWEAGDWHQSEDCGVPLFDDGTVATFSFRGWGDLLAAVWTEQLGRQYCYMDFYYLSTPPKPDDLEARSSMGVKR